MKYTNKTFHNDKLTVTSCELLKKSENTVGGTILGKYRLVTIQTWANSQETAHVDLRTTFLQEQNGPEDGCKFNGYWAPVQLYTNKTFHNDKLTVTSCELLKKSENTVGGTILGKYRLVTIQTWANSQETAHVDLRTTFLQEQNGPEDGCKFNGYWAPVQLVFTRFASKQSTLCGGICMVALSPTEWCIRLFKRPLTFFRRLFVTMF
ncbi:hypothetical protein T265_08116 [Opisthorchis viverrini]|uniref:Uncharacterized protein n=1 Tax=Opisthorchis viverrini TaxID=6198 RepID=A0A074ZAA0_OPIVI|nr:hypothetical protein T265_08116 [Opisthorchis viverrini]KER24181.1 hypothetical protein T265_08116 [Opisthorchis viverrini]